MMDASDVMQGSLGDCYFLTALALVATDTTCAAGLIDDSLDSGGCYGVSFYCDRKWKMVYVDGFFPCYVSTKPHSATKPRPCYAASGNRREIWPMVVEKAFAKLHGCWENIGHGGLISTALQMLTGGVSETYSTSSMGKDALWQVLVDAVENPNCLVGAGTKPMIDEKTSKGIVTGHAYSVMHAISVEGYNLLLLRNPWGHGEWKGDWSDGSKLWETHPNVTKEVGDGRSVEDDGRFWIEISDFKNIFASVDTCRLPGSGHVRSHDAQLHKLVEKEKGTKRKDGKTEANKDKVKGKHKGGKHGKGKGKKH